MRTIGCGIPREARKAAALVYRGAVCVQCAGVRRTSVHLVSNAVESDAADFANVETRGQIFSRRALCYIAVNVLTALCIGCPPRRTFLFLTICAKEAPGALNTFLCAFTVKAIHACANAPDCLFKRTAGFCLDLSGYKQVGGGIPREDSKGVVRKRVWC